MTLETNEKLQRIDTHQLEIHPVYNSTPCVGRCSTVYGDPVCRGCKRFIDEVLHWNLWALPQKHKVWQRLDRLAQQILPEFFHLLDEQQLANFLTQEAIRYPSHLSHWSWVQHAIENFPNRQAPFHKTLGEAGLRIKKEQLHLQSLRQLQLAVQKALFQLSMALHERRDQVLSQ